MEIMNAHLIVKVQFLLFVPQHPLSLCDLLSSINTGHLIWKNTARCASLSTEYAIRYAWDGKWCLLALIVRSFEPVSLTLSFRFLGCKMIKYCKERTEGGDRPSEGEQQRQTMMTKTLLVAAGIMMRAQETVLYGLIWDGVIHCAGESRRRSHRKGCKSDRVCVN